MPILDDWTFTPERIAVHRPTATAVLADLHLGYERSRRRKGEAVPLVGLGNLTSALTSVADQHCVRRLVVAGDVCEDTAGFDLLAEWHAWLEEQKWELVAITSGNHDWGLEKSGLDLPLRPEGITLGEWTIVHGHNDLPEGRVVQGHLHPCVRWRRELAAPCYLVTEERIVLPAFSRDAAGRNVLAVAEWKQARCLVIVGDRLLDFGEAGRIGSAGAIRP